MSILGNKNIIAFLLIVVLVFSFTGCNGSALSKELKTGLSIIVSFDHCIDASAEQNGVAEATALIVAVAADEKDNIKKEYVDVLRAQVLFDENGSIIYVNGTPESILDSGYEIDKEQLSLAREDALEHAQFMGAKQGNEYSFQVYADFGSSFDAFEENNGNAIIYIYAGLCAVDENIISGASLAANSTNICYSSKGIILESSSNSCLSAECYAFASYCKDKTKEEIADIPVDYYTGLAKETELLRQCNTNILPFIEVIK